MAEIQIDRKQGPGPWVWIAGLVVLALVVWGVVEFMGDDRTAQDERETTPAAEQYPVEQQPAQPLPRQEPYTPPPPPQDDPAAPQQPGADAPGTGAGVNQQEPVGTTTGNGNGDGYWRT